MKLKAAAMYYALTISLVIAVLVSLLILLAFFNKTRSIQYSQQINLINNCNSGIEYLKSSNVENGVYTLDLYGNGNDSVFLKKQIWGLYAMISSTAFYKDKKIVKSILLGANSSKHHNTSLFLSNNNKSISLSGKTIIKGNAYLPKGGAKRANIEGKNYVGSELIYGTTNVSENTLPELNPNVLNNLKLNNLQENLVLKTIEDLFTQQNFDISFSENTYLFESKKNINLANVDLQNNIIVNSENIIYVNKNAKLENVLIIAKAVIIEDNFEGSIHIIAQDSIIVGEKVFLNYPSSLIAQSETSNYIKIGNNTQIKGALVLLGKNENKKTPFFKIEEGVEITGDVYCSGKTMLKGSVYGSLFTEGFYLKTPSAVYENYLLDVVIDASQKPKEFLSGIVFNDVEQKQIAKCLE